MSRVTVPGSANFCRPLLTNQAIVRDMLCLASLMEREAAEIRRQSGEHVAACQRVGIEFVDVDPAQGVLWPSDDPARPRASVDGTASHAWDVVS